MAGIDTLIDASLVQKLKVDVISNNLANVTTQAFKKDDICFDQTFSVSTASATDFSPGPFNYTGNKLDVALGVDGFFKIQTSKGVRYTRNGSFALNMEGVLVTQNGDSVMGRNGPIHISGHNVSIERNGRVAVDNEFVDEIGIVDFRETRLLRKEGSSYYGYQGKEEDIFTPEKIHLQQGYLEGSNVNLTEEMVKMISALRVFEAIQKAIQSMDETTAEMVNDPGLIS